MHIRILFSLSVVCLLGACAPKVTTALKVKEVSFEFTETSGITYDAGSDTYYVVSDTGDIAHIDEHGNILQRNNIDNANFEGITRDVHTGLLYAVIEGKDEIVEIDPVRLQPRGTFDVSRKMDGEKIVSGGKQGFEGITFLSDPNHPEGGTFYVVNQATPDQKKPEPSALLHIALPLKTASRDIKKEMKGEILSVAPMPYDDLSGVHYYEKENTLYILSDSGKQVLVFSENGKELKRMSVSGDNMEGITHDGDGNIVIVEDQPGTSSMLIFEEE